MPSKIVSANWIVRELGRIEIGPNGSSSPCLHDPSRYSALNMTGAGTTPNPSSAGAENAASAASTPSPSAVDGDGRPGDISCLHGTEECRNRGKFIRGAKPPCRDLRLPAGHDGSVFVPDRSATCADNSEMRLLIVWPAHQVVDAVHRNLIDRH